MPPLRTRDGSVERSRDSKLEWTEKNKQPTAAKQQVTYNVEIYNDYKR